MNLSNSGSDEYIAWRNKIDLEYHSPSADTPPQTQLVIDWDKLTTRRVKCSK